MATSRPRIPAAIETALLIQSKRICALCFGLNNDMREKAGQIAHLNGNRNDNRFENLVWLCFEHHDRFDSTTSQSKNLTSGEVKVHRDNLYSTRAREGVGHQEMDAARSFLRRYSEIFDAVFASGSELAYMIDSGTLDSIARLLDEWTPSNRFRSFSAQINSLQDGMVEMVGELRSIYRPDHYRVVNDVIKFDTQNVPRDILDGNRMRVGGIASAMLDYHSRLRALVS